MEACIVWTLMNEQAMPFLHGDFLKRTGVLVGSSGARRKMVYDCKDGHISILVAGGMVVGGSTKALVEWMHEQGFGYPWMREKDWISWVPGVFMKMTEREYQEIEELETSIQNFFNTLTKSEIYAGALKWRIFLAPVASAADVAADDQLKARDFWIDVEHDNASARYAPHGAYRAADEDGAERWIAIAVANDDDWGAMLRVLAPNAADSRFATDDARHANAAALDEFVGSLVRDRNARELTAKLQAAGVAAYPVQNCVDIHNDENLESFDFWHWLEHKEMGPSPYEGLQHRLSRTPGELRAAAPILGQHNDEVFHGMLGMSAEEIEQLKKESVIF
jgi:crotonobetainyl-CoA:carnitine CoA-transferase CaiB-like acyl-CoA transferase